LDLGGEGGGTQTWWPEQLLRCRRRGGSCGLGKRRVPRGPNYQVQGRP